MPLLTLTAAKVREKKKHVLASRKKLPIFKGNNNNNKKCTEVDEQGECCSDAR